jgi:hypothetical protein
MDDLVPTSLLEENDVVGNTGYWSLGTGYKPQAFRYPLVVACYLFLDSAINNVNPEGI